MAKVIDHLFAVFVLLEIGRWKDSDPNGIRTLTSDFAFLRDSAVIT
jgi:hypothetical protein